MKKIIILFVTFLFLTSCQEKEKAKEYNISTDRNITDAQKVKIYQGILPSLNFYEVNLPEEARSFSFKIYNIENGNETIFGRVENNLDKLKTRRIFKFAVGVNEDFYIIATDNSTIRIARNKAPDGNLKMGNAIIRSSNQEIHGIKLGESYNLIFEEIGPSKEVYSSSDIKKFKDIKAKDGHIYEVLTLSFSDTKMEN
ncbi:hypothetical protein [Peptoniphilus raoultii]|uniref:hypothetical protein n=1 Tax=Peptoniphilus raoultii TaxID=1776387 RepID=UPI0008D8E914|nr:hypothetical protein [Peptoniphilus raoultii]